MVKLSEWRERVAEAWRGELCNKCGRPMATITVSYDGLVEGYCGWCGHDQVIDLADPPVNLDVEDDPGDLPF